MASFDVYDTVITRAVGEPQALFLLLGRRCQTSGLTTCGPGTFARARRRAEVLARTSVASGEIGLTEIYRELEGVGPGCAPVERLIEAELELERELTRVVPAGTAAVAAARTAGSRVAFVSDTYLSSAFVRENLTTAELFEQGDVCLTSSEASCSKYDGPLYDVLVRRVGVAPSSITHRGDDRHGDVVQARRRGLAAHEADEARLNRFERILEDHRWDTDGLSSAMAGASRLARLRTSAGVVGGEAIREVAAGVAAPALVAFVVWLLLRAERRGLTRLYFVSRDGEVLLSIARRLQPRLGTHLQLRYLYGSRQAWHLPSLAGGIDPGAPWVLEDVHALSPRQFLRRFNLEPEPFADHLLPLGHPPSTWDQPFGEAGPSLGARLLQVPEVVKAVRDRAGEQAELMVRYLRQEGLDDGTEAGLVDLGWRGRARESLSVVLESTGIPLPAAFYFALYRDKPPNAVDVSTYLFGTRPHRPPLHLPGLPTLMEMFAAGSHGPLVGYTAAGDRVEPVFRFDKNIPAMDWGLDTCRRTIFSFVDALVLDSSLIDPDADLRVAVAALIDTLWTHPTPAQAQAWGRFPFERDQQGVWVTPVAMPLTAAAIAARLTRRRDPRADPMWWQGRIAGSAPWVRAVVAGSHRARQLATRPVGPVLRGWRDRSGPMHGR